ncbi:hypothetical protein TNCV_4103281 [Trichonephila clavipes]|nr:hypothetical protein TNCV_4103281 [Trichonephila clavipes]
MHPECPELATGRLMKRTAAWSLQNDIMPGTTFLAESMQNFWNANSPTRNCSSNDPAASIQVSTETLA